MNDKILYFCFVVCVWLCLSPAARHHTTMAFVVAPPAFSGNRASHQLHHLLHHNYGRPSRLRLAATLPDIGTMKMGEIRKELESYGISTKSFLEKTEMIDALEKARAEGKQPTSTATATKPTDDSNSSSESSPNGEVPRDVRMQQELEKANKMKIGELRAKLQELGISTKSFFEKSEFIKAYAEAVVDGVKQKTSRTSGVSNNSKPQQDEEKYDPSYRDVVMKKMDRRDQLLLQGTIIDIPLKR